MISKKIKILVFPGGTENGLEIHKSLSRDKNIDLVSATDDSKNHAEYVFKKNFILPNISDSSFIKKLNRLLDSENIDYIFPANSLVINILSKNREHLASKIILQGKDAVEVAASKFKTYKLLADVLDTPKVYRTLDEILSFPVFVKPDEGYGSQGARIVRHKNDLFESLADDDLIVTEYLPGPEYTVECFSSSDRKLLYCSARTRERIRMGTTMHSEHAEHNIQIDAAAIATKIITKTDIDGLWFFQLKERNDGTLVLLEIETRVAGTMAFSRARGINLPLLYLYYLEGKEFIIRPEKHQVIIDRSLSNKYKLELEYSSVYIDLDDTIVINGIINLEAIEFIYQCKNKNIEVILITKSLVENLDAFLKKYCLLGLFDEVIWLKEIENKENYIKLNSIFIDDSFSQRMAVSKKLNIPTFDPSMLETLIDKKI